MDSTSGLAAEFSDPERITLIERLHKWNDCHMVAVEAWACLWFSDLAKLRYLVDHIDDDVAHSAAVQYILKKGCLATELVQPCMWLPRSLIKPHLLLALTRSSLGHSSSSLLF